MGLQELDAEAEGRKKIAKSRSGPVNVKTWEIRGKD
jgi:hypothetical protein